MDSPASWNPDSPAVPMGKKQWESHRYPVFLTFVVCNGALLFGYHIAFSSPTDSAVRADAGLSQDQSDFMFSLINVGAMVGSLLAGKIADAIGRKAAILINCISFTVGAVIMRFWITYVGLCLGRTIIGFGVGYSSVLVPLYIAETAPASLRGALGCVNQLCIAFSIFLVNVIGLPIVDHPSYWKIMMLLSLVFVVLLFFPLFLFGTETPRWLADHGRINDANKALQKLRGDHANVADELSQLTAKPSRSDSIGNKASESTFAFLCEPHILRPFIIGLFVVMLQQWSGINAFVFNTKSLFQGSGDDNSPSATRKALYGAIIVNAVQTVSTAISAVLVDRAGRRFFLLTSSIGMSISCIVMGFVYFNDAPQAAKIAVVLIYFIFFAVGLGPIPWLLCSEIFPSKGRGLLVSLCTVINWTSSFIVTYTFHKMQDSLNQSGTFWFYGGVCFVGAVGVYFYVPETKGKSLEEIEASFRQYPRHGAHTNERASLLNSVAADS